MTCVNGMGSPLSDTHSRAGSGRPLAGRPFRRTVLAAAGVLVVAAAGLAGAGAAAARLGVSWAVWPGSNTATISLTSGPGLSATKGLPAGCLPVLG